MQWQKACKSGYYHYVVVTLAIPNGKEGVVGSSPIPGFIETPANRPLSGADFVSERLVGDPE